MQLIPPDLLDGFYARSALHIDDDTMMRLAQQIDLALKPGGIVLIEGKGEEDQKIRRSERLRNGLVVDRHERGGHVRRVWTKSFIESMCSKYSWSIEQLLNVVDMTHGETASFIRLIARKSILTP